MGTSHRRCTVRSFARAVTVAVAGLGMLSVGACSATDGARASAPGARSIRVDDVTISVSGSPRIAFFTPFLGNAAIQQLLPEATATGFEAFTKENIHLWQPEVP